MSHWHFKAWYLLHIEWTNSVSGGSLHHHIEGVSVLVCISTWLQVATHSSLQRQRMPESFWHVVQPSMDKTVVSLHFNFSFKNHILPFDSFFQLVLRKDASKLVPLLTTSPLWLVTVRGTSVSPLLDCNKDDNPSGGDKNCGNTSSAPQFIRGNKHFSCIFSWTNGHLICSNK